MISPVPSNDAEPDRSPPSEIVLAVASAVAVSALPVKSPVTLPVRSPDTPPLALIAPLKVETPLTARSSSSECPRTSRPPLASRRPPIVLIPVTLRVSKSLGSKAREASRVALVTASIASMLERVRLPSSVVKTASEST